MSIYSLLKKNITIPVELFSIHKLGENKYKSLGIRMDEIKGIEREQIDEFIEMLLQNGIKAKIMQIG